MTQTDAILALLRERRQQGITALDALNIVSSFRLAARISDLHHAGYSISSEMVTLANGKRIARYRLIEKPVQASLDLIA
jgi:hypothetical protein